MTIFITGATGFLGSYVTERLLANTDKKLSLLTRAKNREEGIQKLWRGLSLHMDAERFYEILPRIQIVSGDLTKDKLGIAPSVYQELIEQTESVLHIAASLNRKSAKACLNHNLRGTLSVVKLARAIQDDHGLRRFSHVSTVAVAGYRDRETVLEDEAVDWERSDYDPYGRTKKFCEHMVRELLPEVQRTYFRPSTVMGDSRFAETSQFDMVRAFCVLADMPVIPFRGDGRVDIVNADWVGDAIATLHEKPDVAHEIYHLSAGEASSTAEEIATAMAASSGRRIPRFVAPLQRPFGFTMNSLASLRSKNTAAYVGSLFKVFLPYITYDTVFDNSRAVAEMGRAPVPFTTYCGRLYEFAKSVDYTYKAPSLPKQASVSQQQVAAP